MGLTWKGLSAEAWLRPLGITRALGEIVCLLGAIGDGFSTFTVEGGIEVTVDGLKFDDV